MQVVGVYKLIGRSGEGGGDITDDSEAPCREAE